MWDDVSVSRTPNKPVTVYTFKSAAVAATEIIRIRFAAGDDALPSAVVDDDDIDQVIAYTQRHSKVGRGVRADELPHRALLVEYRRQRDVERYERAQLAVLQSGHELGLHPVSYGEPMGLRLRQVVFNRRTRLARKWATVAERAVEEGRAQQWVDEHARQLRVLADVLVDNRDELLDLVNGDAARGELVRNIDEAGAHPSPRPTPDLSFALASAVDLLRPGRARPASDLYVREVLEQGLLLLWPKEI
jgi:hypothetical protein